MSIFYSNKIVLSDDVIKGCIVVENGKIVDIQKDQKPVGAHIDLTDKFVLPGFINISSSDYAGEVKSSYNRYFTEEKIFYQIDRLLAESGVTTNFHTFHLEDLLRDKTIKDAIEYLGRIKSGQNQKHFVDHKIHLTFRLGGQMANRNLRELILSGVVDFITCTGLYSRDVFNYRNQYFVQNLQDRFDLNDEEAAQALQMLIDLREESALDDLSYRIKLAKNANIPFASTRFNLIKKLEKEYKVDINIISGEHTRRTIDLIKEDKIHYMYDVESFAKSDDVLEFAELLSEKAVDIITASSRSKDILEYIFEIEGLLGLPEAVNLFSLYPSQALNLSERGDISVGKKADFVVVEMFRDTPTVSAIILNGKMAIQYDYE